MTISLSFIPGVMIGFEFVDGNDDYDDCSSSYIVIDAFIVRILIEY